MPHRYKRECNHDCEGCDFADPALCKDWAEMTHIDHHIRYCRDCGEQAEHRVSTLFNGDGDSHTVDVWICPRCRRVFG